MSNEQHTSVAVQLPLLEHITIKLTQGFEAIIDPIDADLTSVKWCIHGRGDYLYAKRRVNNIAIFMHRIIAERILKRPIQLDEEVDHIDGNGLNNTRTNLRIGSHQQNLRNTKRRTDNHSGYKGISSHPSTKKWRAKIRWHGKQIHLGYFDTPEEAHAAYCDAAKKYYGEFARLK